MLIHRDALEIHRVTSKDGRRYSLNSILVEADGTLVATDSYRLMRVKGSAATDEEYPSIQGLEKPNGAELEPFHLPADAAKQLIKAIGRKKRHFYCLEHARIDNKATNENGHAVIGVSDMESEQVFRPEKVDGRFPKYADIYPKGDPKATVTVNAAYLAEICGVLKRLTEQNHTAVRLSFYGDDKPLKLEAVGNKGEAGRADALLMPALLVISD